VPAFYLTELRRLRAEVQLLRDLIISQPDDLAARIEWYRSGFERGSAAGHEEGWDDSEADMAAAWSKMARRVTMTHEQAEQEMAAITGPDAVERTIRIAEALDRIDAEKHEEGFIRRAYATPQQSRTAMQEAVCHLYPANNPIGRPRKRRPMP
jgi:hypothetical protein